MGLPIKGLIFFRGIRLLPPLAGIIAKFFIFSQILSLYESRIPVLHLSKLDT